MIRTGYGIYYEISNAAANANAISPNAPGFYAPTAWQTSVPSNPATPPAGLSNPFPGRWGWGGPHHRKFVRIADESSAGQTVDYERTMNQTPYEQSWSFGIERQLPGNMLFDTEYIGKKGTHEYLGISGDFNVNHLGPQEEQDIGNGAWVKAMDTQVPNPFYGAGAGQGVIQQGNLLSPSVTQYSLDLPYPQFQGLDYNGAPWSNLEL